MNATESFRVAMRQAGLDYGGAIVANGRLHRFKAAGDHARNSWYVLYDGTPAAGVFGCWKRNFTKKWHDRGAEKLTTAERDAIRRRIAEAGAERKRVEKLRQRKARKIAKWILSRSKPADAGHPYLVAKRVRPHGELRQWRGKLVIPLRDSEGDLHSLQFIGPGGSKLFLAGGRVAGCFFALPDASAAVLVICEGYATAASIAEATGLPTVAAMNCGNLLAVATALRGKWPQRDIIIAADNDQWTDGNPGVTKATRAAKASHARLLVPQFKDTTTKPTDFNDLAQLEGNNAVKDQVEASAPTVTATMPSDWFTQKFPALAAEHGAAVLEKIEEDGTVWCGTSARILLRRHWATKAARMRQRSFCPPRRNSTPTPRRMAFLSTNASRHYR